MQRAAEQSGARLFLGCLAGAARSKVIAKEVGPDEQAEQPGPEAKLRVADREQPADEARSGPARHAAGCECVLGRQPSQCLPDMKPELRSLRGL